MVLNHWFSSQSVLNEINFFGAYWLLQKFWSVLGLLELQKLSFFLSIFCSKLWTVLGIPKCLLNIGCCNPNFGLITKPCALRLFMLGSRSHIGSVVLLLAAICRLLFIYTQYCTEWVFECCFWGKLQMLFRLCTITKLNLLCTYLESFLFQSLRVFMYNG